MRGYPDGMKRLTRFAPLAAVAGLLALPASAQSPAGWRASSDVQGTYTVLRTADGLAIAGGLNGAIATSGPGEVTTDAADPALAWKAVTPPTDAAIRDVAGAMAQTLFAIDARGVLWRSDDSGSTW